MDIGGGGASLVEVDTGAGVFLRLLASSTRFQRTGLSLSERRFQLAVLARKSRAFLGMLLGVMSEALEDVNVVRAPATIGAAVGNSKVELNEALEFFEQFILLIVGLERR